MCQRGEGIDVEDWESVTTILYTPLVQNDGNKVQTRGAEERGARGTRQMPNISSRDVSDDVIPIVHHSNAGETLFIHHGQGIRQRSIGANRRNGLSVMGDPMFRPGQRLVLY